MGEDEERAPPPPDEERVEAILRATQGMILVLKEIGIWWPDVFRAVSLVLLDAAQRAARAACEGGMAPEYYRIDFQQAGSKAGECAEVIVGDGTGANPNPPTQIAAFWILISDFAVAFEEDGARAMAINRAAAERFYETKEPDMPADPGERFMAIAKILGAEVEGFELIASMTEDELASLRRHQAARRRREDGPTVH